MTEWLAAQFIAARAPYQPKPHVPKRAATEAKRQRRARERAVERRRARRLKGWAHG